MLQPKRTKFRKTQKGRNRGLAERGSKVSFGEYALKATGRGRITARQIEAARRAMTRTIRAEIGRRYRGIAAVCIRRHRRTAGPPAERARRREQCGGLVRRRNGGGWVLRAVSGSPGGRA